jgi:hypothetical protein
MKQQITILQVLIISIILSTGTVAQNAKLNAFYAKYKHRPNTTSMTLPGWLIKIGIAVSEEDQEWKEYKPLMRGLHSMKVLVMEEKNYASTKEVKALVNHAREHQFQDLIAVKDGKERINILLREKPKSKKGIIKNVMILVCEEDELVLVTFNGRWKKNQVTKMLKKAIEEEGSFMGAIVSSD